MSARVSRLEYIGLKVRDPRTWEDFASSVLGLRAHTPRGTGPTHFRMDERHHRLSVQGGEADDLAHLGWHVDGEDDLQAIADRLEATGTPVAWASAAEAEARGADRLFRVRDPSGLVTEVVCGSHPASHASGPAAPERFVTGDLGVGHVAVFAPDPEATIRFHVEGLGLQLSDTIELDLGAAGRGRATFLHAGPRHHALAIIPVAGPTHLHHLMLQLRDMDDVGRCHDRCIEQRIPIEMDFGRHTNDEMTSFYMRSPAGFLVEVGCGGRVIDDETWQVEHYDRPSVWGHAPPAPPA